MAQPRDHNRLVGPQVSEPDLVTVRVRKDDVFDDRQVGHRRIVLCVRGGGSMAKDLTIVLRNVPGTIADVAEAMGKAGVNIEGACGFPAGFAAGTEGIFHILVEDVDAARAAAEQAGYEVRGERDVLVSEVQNRPGALGETTRKLADAGINVDLIYATADGKIVLGPDDIDKARAAL